MSDTAATLHTAYYRSTKMFIQKHLTKTDTISVKSVSFLFDNNKEKSLFHEGSVCLNIQSKGKLNSCEQ